MIRHIAGETYLFIAGTDLVPATNTPVKNRPNVNITKAGMEIAVMEAYLSQSEYTDKSSFGAR